MIELLLMPYLASPDRLSFDVGASVGTYGRELVPLSREVHLFEPIPEAAYSLIDTFSSTKNAYVYPTAVSDRVGFADLRLPTLDTLGEWPPLATIEDANNLDGLPSRKIRVMTCSLDSLNLRDVGFIKIDVEGHELAVLKGAVDILQRDHPNILIDAEERHSAGTVSKISAFLSAFGYEGIFRSDSNNNFINASNFDALKHQNIDNIGNIEYCSDFIFSTDVNLLSRCSESGSLRLPVEFRKSRYLELHDDVRAAGIDPALHYLLHGRREGREWQ